MTIINQYVQAPEISVDGSKLDPDWVPMLVSMNLDLALQVPARLTLRFVDPGDNAPGELPFKIGTSVKVSLPTSAPGRAVEFEVLAEHLEVTEVAAERDFGRTPEWIVVAEDLAHTLTQRHRVTTYLNMSASEVVSKLATEAGLSTAIQSTSEKHPYLMQSDTDFGFISTLARRHGYDWWVDGKTLHFAEPPSSPPSVALDVDDHLFRLSVRASSVPTKDVVVNGWDAAAKTLISAKATPPERTDVTIPGASGSAHAKSTPLTTASVRPGSTGEATQLAKAIAARQTTTSTTAEGELPGHTSIRPRTTIDLAGKRISGKYPVTRAEHRFGPDGYTTRFVAGGREPHGLADLIGGGSTAHGLGAFDGFSSAMPAVVTAIGKDENLGRVKVKFTYMSNEDESHWARVLSAGGGPERGFWFLPEVDDEVLVMFEGGDVRYPVVMGGLYGKVQSPEEQLVKDGKISTRAVRSRLGHHMELGDGTDAKSRHILLGLGKDGKAGTEYKLRMGEDRFDIEVPSGKPIAIKSGTSQITFTDKGAIQITADEIAIKANKELKLEGQKVVVTGQLEVAISQGAANKIALGSSGAEIKGAPTTSIKGSPQVAIG